MEWNGMEWNGMEWNGMECNGMQWNAMSSLWRHACRARRGARHRHIAPIQRVVGAPPAMLSQTDARRILGRWLATRSPLPHWPAKGGNEPIPAATRQPSSSRRREDRRDQNTHKIGATRAQNGRRRERDETRRVCATRGPLGWFTIKLYYITSHYMTLHYITLRTCATRSPLVWRRARECSA